MQKRIAIALLGGMMAIMLVACGNKAVKTTDNDDVVVTEGAVVTEAPTVTEAVVTEAPTVTEGAVVTEAPTMTETPVATEDIEEVELTDQAKAMIPLFEAMNNFYYEIGIDEYWSLISSVDYDAEDNMQYWGCIARVGSQCGELYGELAVEEGDNYRIRADVIREFAYCCFADRNQLDTVPLPDSLDGTIYYDYDWDAYYVKAGDAGFVSTVVTSFIDNKDGSYVAEVDYVDGKDGNVLQHFTYELVDNEIADMSLFPYSVKNLIREAKDN